MKACLLLITLIPSICFAQMNWKSDTTCYHQVSIAIPNDSLHGSLFDMNNPNSLFQVVYQLNRLQLLPLEYYQEVKVSCCLDYTYSLEQMKQDSSLHAFYDVEMMRDVHIYRFVDYEKSQVPIVEWNEDYQEFIEHFEYDSVGNVVYKYYSMDTVTISFTNLFEARIIETNVGEVGQPRMTLSKLSFFSEEYDGLHAVVWVDFEKLKYAIESSRLDKTKLPWLKMLDNREYGGFRYHQVSCYDKIHR